MTTDEIDEMFRTRTMYGTVVQSLGWAPDVTYMLVGAAEASDRVWGVVLAAWPPSKVWSDGDIIAIALPELRDRFHLLEPRPSLRGGPL